VGILFLPVPEPAWGFSWSSLPMSQTSLTCRLCANLGPPVCWCLKCRPSWITCDPAFWELMCVMLSVLPEVLQRGDRATSVCPLPQVGAQKIWENNADIKHKPFPRLSNSSCFAILKASILICVCGGLNIHLVLDHLKYTSEHFPHRSPLKNNFEKS
jgi:hypothetical protein